MHMNGTNVTHKIWQNLAVYLEFFMEQFLLEPLAGDFKFATGLTMLKSFPLCLAKIEKKAQSLQITLKWFLPITKGCKKQA